MTLSSMWILQFHEKKCKATENAHKVTNRQGEKSPKRKGKTKDERKKGNKNWKN